MWSVVVKEREKLRSRGCATRAQGKRQASAGWDSRCHVQARKYRRHNPRSSRREKSSRDSRPSPPPTPAAGPATALQKMAATKRKEAPSAPSKSAAKKQKTSRLDAAAANESPDEASTTTTARQPHAEPKKFKLDTSSAEAHAKQRQLAKERKAAKPNSDVIARSKKIWERLRRKSHVPAKERKELVAELFTILAGRVREFVFKHDSVRVVQTALKYADKEQRLMIVRELRGDVRALAESRYGKFLVAKMVVEGNQEVRDLVIPEFYGGVRKLAGHPEAGWIVDDIYRQIATAGQKRAMLREWYGAEFALANKGTGKAAEEETADLKEILAKHPEKRRPIMEHLLQMLNSLLQKKLTGFTMLHDAMLQYFLALTPGSEEFTDFLDLLKADIETAAEAKDSTDASGGGDLYRNLAFTRSGSKLVCYALAYGTAKDRKIILRCFRETVEMMAYDQHAKMVLIVGLDVPDDTKMSSKAILSELLGSNLTDETARLNRLEELSTHLVARIPLLYPLAGPTKWLMPDPKDTDFLAAVHDIRKETSKKDPALRRQGLLEVLSPALLELLAARAGSLVKSSFGCQLITETLLTPPPATVEKGGELRQKAAQAVAALAAGSPIASSDNKDGGADDDDDEAQHPANNPAASRMLKILILGGSFDPATKTTILSEPRLGFASMLWPVMKANVVEWACGGGSFAALALLESEDVEDRVRMEAEKELRKGRMSIEQAARGEGGKGNKGAEKVLEKLG